MSARLKLLRVCAVGSSLLLGAAFVAYRARAAGGSRQADSMAVDASPSPTARPAAKSPTEHVARFPTQDPVLMGGSKSMVVRPLPAEGPPRLELRPWPLPTTPPDHPIIFGGSKSLVLDPAPPPATPTPEK